MKTDEVVEKSTVYSLLDELLWCGKSETPILSVTGGQDEEVTNDINLLRRRLETERKRLMQELEGLKTNVCPEAERQVSSLWAKEDEHATEIAELRIRSALEKLLGDRLAEVEHALYKFDRGTYGVCDFCGHPIDPGRVEAFPQASLCLNCKAHEGVAKEDEQKEG